MNARLTPPHYESYLLRLRWVEHAGRLTCQAMLQSVRTKEQHYFANLDDVFVFLRAEAERVVERESESEDVAKAPQEASDVNEK